MAFQILVQHIRAILPDLKARISTQMVTLQKELASYGELTETKVFYDLHMLVICQGLGVPNVDQHIFIPSIVCSSA